MKVKVVIFVLTFCVILFSVKIVALIVGSNTAVSRQSAVVVFPSEDGDNEIRGFTVLEHGFTLEDNVTTCTYNGIFPTSGDVSLSGGRLELFRNFILEPVAQIVSGGFIYGRHHFFEFPKCCPKQFYVPSAGAAESFALIAQEDTGNQVYANAWSHDDLYLAAGTEDDNSDDELKIYYFDTHSLTLTIQADVGDDIYDLDWHPFAYYLAVARDRSPGQNSLYVYYLNVADGTLTLTASDDTYLSDVVAVDWHPSGNYLAIGSKDNNKEVVVYSFSPGNLTQLDSYSFTPDRDILWGSINWDPEGTYLATGCNASAGQPELNIFYFDGSNITLTISQTNGRDCRSVDWLPSGTFISVGLDAGTESLRMYEHDVASGTLTEQTSMRVGETVQINSLDWRNCECFLAIATDESPSAPELKLYGFNKTAMTLFYNTGIEVDEDVYSAHWSHNNTYLSIDGHDDNIDVYRFVVPCCFLFNDTTIIFNSTVYLQRPLSLSGNCCIEGNNNTLHLHTDELRVCYGSSALIKDLIIEDVYGTKLECFDNVGTLSLKNVTLVLEGDYTFTLGHFEIIGDVWITGTSVFAYQSTQTSKICYNSTLHFDSGSTFSYDTYSARNLWEMEDFSSTLHLYDATLFSVAPGLQLTKGALVIEGECRIENDATMHDDGITIGDGISASNDVTLRILPESGPYATTGWFNYKNIT